jgi:hypothetical protein
MTANQIGPLFVVNGPLPRQPRYTLVGSADIDPTTDEHWANGIQVYGYIPDVACRFVVCGEGDEQVKNDQENPNPLPTFAPLTVYLTETCPARSIWSGSLSQDGANAAFQQRARDVFAAVESGAVEREFWGGDFLPDNPHLASADCDVLNSGSATSIVNGLALLEEAIAQTNRAGVIHMTAALALAITSLGGGGILQPQGGKLYTVNGTLVIPAYGYPGSAPSGQADNTGTEEFAYATGPVELLRSEAFIMPDQLWEALDRSTNEITYRAERYYIPYWDTALQAGVRIDRCFTTCDS